MTLLTVSCGMLGGLGISEFGQRVPHRLYLLVTTKQHPALLQKAAR